MPIGNNAPATHSTRADHTTDVMVVLTGAAAAAVILVTFPGVGDALGWIAQEATIWVYNMWSHMISLMTGHGWAIMEDSPFFNCATMGNRICG
jgi:hypothetical protein